MSRAAAPTRSDFQLAVAKAKSGKRAVLREGGKAFAAVVPIADLKRLEKLEDEEDVRDVRAARREIKLKGTIPWEKVKAELGLK